MRQEVTVHEAMVLQDQEPLQDLVQEAAAPEAVRQLQEIAVLPLQKK